MYKYIALRQKLTTCAGEVHILGSHVLHVCTMTPMRCVGVGQGPVGAGGVPGGPEAGWPAHGVQPGLSGHAQADPPWQVSSLLTVLI